MGFKWLNNLGSKAKNYAGKIGSGIVSGAKWTGNKAIQGANYIGSGVKKLNDLDNRTGGHIKKGLLNGTHILGNMALDYFGGGSDWAKAGKEGLNALHESLNGSLGIHKYNKGYTSAKDRTRSFSASSLGGVRVSDAGGDYASFGKRKMINANYMTGKSF